MKEWLTVHDLNTAERVVLVSFRLWALRIAAPNRTHMNWEAAFEAASIGNIACPVFDALMGTLFSTSRRVIEVHRATCACMSVDEQELILCIGLCQNDQADAATEILSQWLPPAAAGIIVSQASNLSMVMRNAGLFFPSRKSGLLPSLKIPTGVGLGLHFVH